MTISIKSDLLFKRCFANAEHPEVVAHFIEDVLGLSVYNIKIANPYSIDEFIDAEGSPGLRHTEVDVLVRLNDQRLVTAEIQRAPQSFYLQRSVYYLASRYADDYGRKTFMQTDCSDGSEKYSSLFPVFGINIVDFPLFGNDQRLLHSFSFRDDETFERLMPESMLNLCYIELGKKPPSHLKHWVDFLNDKPAASDAPDYIKQAYALVNYANLDREERRMISAEERREQDYIGIMNYAKKQASAEGWAEGEAAGRAAGKAKGMAEGKAEGIAEGIAEGKAESKAEIARSLLAANMLPAEVAKHTGLTEQDVLKLA